MAQSLFGTQRFPVQSQKVLSQPSSSWIARQLAAFPSEFPTVLDYWSSTTYCLLLLAHTLLSMLFYYTALTAAHSMGSARGM